MPESVRYPKRIQHTIEAIPPCLSAVIVDEAGMLALFESAVADNL